MFIPNQYFLIVQVKQNVWIHSLKVSRAVAGMITAKIETASVNGTGNFYFRQFTFSSSFNILPIIARHIGDRIAPIVCDESIRNPNKVELKRNESKDKGI